MTRFLTLSWLAVGCAADPGPGGKGDPGVGDTDASGPPSAPLTVLPPDDAALPDNGEGPLQYEQVVPVRRDDALAFPIYAFVPPEPVALVFLFHGSGLSADTYVHNVETIAVTNELVVEGFGFVALDAAGDAWAGAPADPGGNTDVAHAFEVRDHLIATTSIAPETPVYAVGFSSGGAFTSTFAAAAIEAGWDVRATAPHAAGAPAFGLAADVIWVWPENDSTDWAGLPERVERHAADGWGAELLIAEERALTAAFIGRDPDITPAQATAMFEDCVRLGLVDEDGERLVEQLQRGVDAFVDQGTVPGRVALAERHLKVAWAMHRMNGQHARAVRDFFLESL